MSLPDCAIDATKSAGDLCGFKGGYFAPHKWGRSNTLR